MTTMKMQRSRAGILLSLCLLCAATRTAAFGALPPPPLPFQSAALRGGGVGNQVTNRVERSASYSVGDAGNNKNNCCSSDEKHSSSSMRRSGVLFGWNTNNAAAGGGGRTVGKRDLQQQTRQDWSKLFASPEPEPVQGRPLVGLSRSLAAVARGSCYSSPLFLGMILLMNMFSPLVAAQSLATWGLGRLAYWLSMRGEEVSVRMPAGFIGYASLFLVVGGMVFMNGLKGISNIAILP